MALRKKAKLRTKKNKKKETKMIMLSYREKEDKKS